MWGLHFQSSRLGGGSSLAPDAVFGGLPVLCRSTKALPIRLEKSGFH